MVFEDSVTLRDCSGVGDDVKLAVLVVVLSGSKWDGTLLDSFRLSEGVLVEDLM